jgi:predicted MPP superfamily phosphohydrolase
VSLETVLAELRARIALQAGSTTLLLAVVPSDAVVEEVKRPLLELLRATPMDVADLGACTSSMGPARWAELTRARAATAAESVYVLSYVPVTALEARTFANLLNAERQHMRELAGPMLLVVSNKTEQALRSHAHDFYTWAAHGFALPEPRELLALAASLGVATAMAAPVESPVRFLHVSDFHLRPARVSRYDQDRVLDGLVRFLERDRAGFPLDLVFVTGDLAWSGKAEEFGLVEELLRRLLAATGVPRERMFVVPGNHDVDRSVGRWLVRTLDSDAEAIAFFEEPDGRAFHRRKLQAYEATLQQVVGTGRSLGLGVGAEAVEIVEVAGTRLAVASFNSSWFSQGDGDQGMLWLGEPNVRRALGRIADADAAFAIALVHHPFDYLHEGERELVETWFERGFDLVLRGHLHRNKTRSIASQRGGYVEVAAPASYQGSQWPNGCFLGEIRSKARTVRLRPYTFAAGPDPWVLDPKVFPDDVDDGHCRTFTIPPRQRRKSGMSTAARMAVQHAYDQATPYQKQHVRRQVLGERADMMDQYADHEVVVRLAEEPPELRAKVLGNVDRNVALVSAIESQSLAGPSPHPHIDIGDAEGFERALVQAGRLFLEHTAKQGVQRERMSERDAIAGLVASLGMVVDVPITAEVELGGSRRADIVMGGREAVIEVVRASKAGLDRKLHELDHYREVGEVRHAAVVVLGSLPEPACEPTIERVTTPAGRNAWIVRL